MTCCKEKIIQRIICQFSGGCASQLKDVLPFYWDMALCISGGNCELQMLIVRQQAIGFLMGCEAQSYDTEESHFTLVAEARATVRSDFNSQLQSTSSSNRFGNEKGETKYDESNNAQSEYNSLRTGRAEDVSDGSSFFRDDGRGFGTNRSDSFNFIRNRTNHLLARKVNRINKSANGHHDCNWEYSHNNKSGSAGTISAGILGGYGFTGSTSEWRKYQRSQSQGSDHDEATNYADGYEDDDGLHTTRGTHRWEDQFLGDIEWLDKEAIKRFHNERFDSRREASAHAEGAGNGLNERRDEMHSAAQGTGQQRGDGESHRLSTRNSNLNAFQVLNSQRFTNLLRLYDQLVEQIAHVRKRIIANSLPAIDVIPCYCYGECCCMQRLGHELFNRFNSHSVAGSSRMWYPGS